MKIIFTCLASLALLLEARVAAAPVSAYVWDFTTRDTFEKSDLASKFTYDFEEALSGCQGYQVLERRRMDRFLKHSSNERSVSDVSSNNLAALKIAGAEQVIFGEIFDDKDSGEVSITVTFEDFSGRKQKIKRASIQRGLVNDAASRSKAMAGLVLQLCESKVPSSPPPEPRTNSEAKTPAAPADAKLPGNIVIWASTQKYTFPENASGKMAELRTLAAKDDFKQALRPFAAPGIMQPVKAGSTRRYDPDKSGTAKPVSYSKLDMVGALRTDLQGQELIVKFAITHEDKNRPRWSVSLSPKQWSDADRKLIQNTQTWINTYHDEMVQVGMMSE